MLICKSYETPESQVFIQFYHPIIMIIIHVIDRELIILLEADYTTCVTLELDRVHSLQQKGEGIMYRLY